MFRFSANTLTHSRLKLKRAFAAVAATIVFRKAVMLDVRSFISQFTALPSTGMSLSLLLASASCSQFLSVCSSFHRIAGTTVFVSRPPFPVLGFRTVYIN